MNRRIGTVRAGILAVVVAMGVAACSSGGEIAADPTPAQETSAPEETTAAPDNGSVELPASAELRGRRLTVEAFGSTTLNFAEPDAGQEAVFIEVTVEDLSADTWSSSLFQFFLVDQNGEEWGPELLGSEAGPSLPDVDVAAGETSTGFVAFQVPEGSRLTLSYAVDLGAGETIDIPVR